MKPRIRIVYAVFLGALVSLWLIPSAWAQSAFTLDQVFAKMDAVSKTFKSVQADLERTSVTVVVDKKDVATGKFYYSPVNKEPRLKLDMVKPEQHLLIDKGLGQLYEPNIKQVKRFSLSGHKDQVETYMSLGFGQSSQDLKQNFTVTLVGDDTIDGKKATMLDLVPKASTGFKSFRLWVDQQTWTADQIKVTETSKDYQIFKYSNAKLNSNIPASVFDLKLPKDVNVLK